MYSIEKHFEGKPYPLGVTTINKVTYFSAVMKNETDCGLILYDKKTGVNERIPFPAEQRFGSIFCIGLRDFDKKKYEYCFYDGETCIVDPYAKVIHGFEKWGEHSSNPRGGFFPENYDWEQDRFLKIPYEDSIFYCLNVRAFTMHKTSKVKKKGSFYGIIEKIPYLKSLGITGIELMPAYEYNEIESNDKIYTMLDVLKSLEQEQEAENRETKLNCWGYKNGYYFAPKAAFASSSDCVSEFRDMVKELHRNGIEVLMQFYFPPDVAPGLILEVARHWVVEYHIDGIHFKGDSVPIHLIASDPLFTKIKLLYHDFPEAELNKRQKLGCNKNLALYQDDFMYVIRRFLKGDENMTSPFLEMNRRNNGVVQPINYITNYYGFTLFDLVSYERKHNRANGEENRDGIEMNFTWNCGSEGISRKKAVCELRMRQIKNALMMLFLAQGTPLIYSGDEMGNTRYGNNNPYCQDNETGWVKWNETGVSRTLYTITKQLITLRKNHPVLHQLQEPRLLDYMACGYPDLSYHGEEAFRPDLSHSSRSVGLMYCGSYSKTEKDQEDNFIYLAYNMHWLEHRFALPKLPKGMVWCLLADTGTALDDEIFIADKERAHTMKEQEVTVKARSVQLYLSKQTQAGETDPRKQYQKTAF